MEKIAAIYVIINKVNHKIYLGSTNDFTGRYNWHFSYLKRKKHWNKHLQRAWNKYGENNFTIFSIEEFNEISGNSLIKKEAKYIKKFNLVDIGYNIQRDPTDVSGKNNPMYNKKHTYKTKKKISETRKRLGLSNGKNNPMYGRTGERSSGYGKPGTMLGKKQKLESKEKIGLANLGREVTLETRKKLHNASKKYSRDSFGRFRERIKREQKT